MILLLTFPHSFSSYTLCILLPHAYYSLFTFLFPSTDFHFFHVQPYCLCIASCTVLNSLLTNVQPTQAEPCYTVYKHRIDSSIRQLVVMILLLTFPHSFSLYTLCMLLSHVYYFLFTFLFPSTDFLFFHAQPYCLCVASCTVLHSSAQSAY